MAAVRAVLPRVHFFISCLCCLIVAGAVAEDETWECIYFPTHANDTEGININISVIFYDWSYITQVNSTSHLLEYRGRYEAGREGGKISLMNYAYNHENVKQMVGLGLVVFAEAIKFGLMNATQVKVMKDHMCAKVESRTNATTATFNQSQFVIWFEQSSAQFKLWNIELIKPLFSCWLVMWVSIYLRRQR